MGIRLRQGEWQRQLRKFFTNPVTEVLALVALVLAALALLVLSEARHISGPHAPVVLSPR